MRRMLVGWMAMLTVGTTALGQDGWKAGAAKVVITPPKLMWMSGYSARTKPAEGKVHDLWAKALVLESADGKRLALVTLDLVGIPRPVSQAITKKLEATHKLPRESVVLSVSHTHCGPVVRDNLDAMYMLDAEQQRLITEYSASLPGLVNDAVTGALAKLAPAKVSWSIGQAGFAVNRRNNKEADVPMLREKGDLKGPIDHDVPVLAVHDLAGKLRAVAFGYACHATVLSFQMWCGDYPGFAMIELEKSHPDAVALFWAGCGADQNPLPRRTVALAENYGQQLARAVENVLAKPMTTLPAKLAAAYTEIPLAFDELPTREQLAKDALSTNRYIAVRAKSLLERLQKEGSLSATYPYPVQAIRLGQDLSWITLGGEVVVDYTLRLKKELGPGKTWVMGYANDVMAYIPSLRVLKEGGYEGASSMIYYGQPTVWGPRVEESIVQAVHEQVKKVK